MKGFTLIELIIVIALMAIVAALSLPFLQTSQVKSDLNSSTQEIVQILRQTQQQAAAGKNNDSWGAYFNNGEKSLVIFKGANFANRDTDYDLKISYPDSFSLVTDFGPEIIFTLHSGLPSPEGQIILSDQNNESKIIIINSLGQVAFKS
jgi:prepilin-type N-terminal cleavage/methylation domain-containing protein